MNSLAYNFTMEEQKPSFVSNGETKVTNTESFAHPENRSMNNSSEGGFSALAAPFQCRGGNELLTFLSQQEPRQAETDFLAPTQPDVDMMNFHTNSSVGSEILFDDAEQNNHNYYMGGRSESMVSSHGWNDGSSGVSAARNGDMIDTFDFLVKCLSSANNYVSMLTREQLYVLRSIRPSLLYEFLQEVAKVRGDKRMRRALPNECAFCKNNGENEECYTKHALKDWRGRVECPVLRAFRCPRCGATGDHAHTIKYCPENPASERGGLSSRRRGAPPPLLLQGRGHHTAPPTPAPAPSPSSALPHSSLWGNLYVNKELFQ